MNNVFIYLFVYAPIAIIMLGILIGIGFAYKSDGQKETQTKYWDKTSDYLRRKFGNDLVGWDMATTKDLIKGFEL